MSDLVQECPESILEKIRQYEGNLSTVKQALVESPDSEEFQKLFADLTEIIHSLRELYIVKGGILENVQSEHLQRVGDGTATSTTAAEGHVVSESQKRKSLISTLTRRTCVLTAFDKHCPDKAIGSLGEVTGIGETDPVTGMPQVVQVLWFGMRRAVPVSAVSIRLLNPLPASSVHIGMHVQAIYHDDGKWYPCVIQDIREDGFVVKWSEYDTTDFCRADRVRLLGSHVAPDAGPHTNKKRPLKEIQTPGGYVIPENLLVKPIDTPAQRAEKKRRVNNLKREQKALREEKECRAAQSVWSSHHRNVRQKCAFEGRKLENKEILSVEQSALLQAQEAKKKAFFSSTDHGKDD